MDHASIREIPGGYKLTKRDSTALPRRSSSHAVLPTLVAVGGTVAAAPAGAIQLSDIQVQSKLGQPLRASIAYALAPNEILESYCISVSGAPSSSGLPTVINTRVRVADGIITLTGSTPVREPIISLRLSVNCPYAANLTREYMMFIDPANLAVAPAPQASAAATVPAATPVARETPPSPRAPARSEPVAQGARYRVQPGESLSEIAQRIEDRSVGLWPAVNAIFEANPDAFINADPNRLKAGSFLTIPEFIGNEVAQFEPATESVTREPAITAATESTAAPALTDPVVAPEAESPAIVERSETIESAEAAFTDAANTSSITDTVFEPLDAAAPVAEQPAEAPVETIVIPDTPLESPVVSNNPNRSVARIEPVEAVVAEPGSNWGRTALFTGGGLGLLIALLFFSRGIFSRFGSTPVAVDTQPARRRVLEPEPEPMEVEESNFDLSDDSPTDQNPTLDADIIFGHDMDGDVDVNFDEGFDATAAIDFELPDGETAEQETTDIIPPPQVEESSILAAEVLPEDDDYDMSVIVDVTKMPSADEVTERDLQAIEIDSDSDDGEYTLNDAIDYDILEQDYQDELTATQALNLEIEKAARELNERLMDDEQDDADVTTNVQISDIAELDVTAEIPAQNEEVLSDLDDTNVNEALDPSDFEKTEALVREEKTVDMLRDDETVEMRSSDATAEMPAVDATAEMPALDEDIDDDKTLEVMTSDGDHTVEIVTRDDDTVEMEVESGRVDTKAL